MKTFLVQKQKTKNGVFTAKNNEKDTERPETRDV
jgi:hypothetical protein